MPARLPPDEIAQLMRFIAKKTKNVESPISLSGLAAEFKEKSGSLMTLRGLRGRIEYLRRRIHKMDEFDMDTKVKMMFALSAPIEKGFLKELKKQAEVEVDEKGRITKYKANDGNLELNGSHGLSAIRKSVFANRWHTICENTNKVVPENEDEEDANEIKDYERKRIDLVRFLIKQTKNATSPLSLHKLAKDYKAEFKSSESPDTTKERRIQMFKCSESQHSIRHQIIDFRQRIHRMHQFDTPTKVKMLFALSVSIDDDLLKELQKSAIVELDDELRIKKYKARDGSLELEGDHSVWAKRREGLANKNKKKKARVVNDSSESEEDDDEEEDSSGTDERDEEEEGENVGESTRSNQISTSSSARRRDRLRKSTISLRNKNKKKQLSEKSSDFTHTRNYAKMSRAKKRARISSSFSESSEDLENDSPESVFSQHLPSIPKGRKRARQVSEDEKSLKLEDDSENLNHIPDERKPESLIDANNSDEFDYDPSNFELDTDHLPVDKKPESLMEVNTEESSTITLGNHYEDNFFDYDQLNYVDEHIPEEKKPESLMEVKTELPEEPSGDENGLIESKIEECAREVKQEADEDVEGPSTTSSLNISLLKFLYYFRRPVIKLNIPFVANKFDNEIKKLEEKDQQISITKILKSLESLIKILKTPDEMDLHENTIFLSDFIDQFGLSTWYISHPLINEFQRKTRELVATEDQKIPVEHIRYAMENALDNILH